MSRKISVESKIVNYVRTASPERVHIVFALVRDAYRERFAAKPDVVKAPRKRRTPKPKPVEAETATGASA